MQPKVFTLEEANRMVPVLSQRFERIWALGEHIRNLDIDLKSIASIWGDDIYRRANPDHSYFHSLLAKRCTATKELAELLDIVGSIGCIVRDIEGGFVDFYSKRGNDTVCLCWRYGEKRIKWWHPLSAGSKVRRPVEEIAATEMLKSAQVAQMSSLW